VAELNKPEYTERDRTIDEFITKLLAFSKDDRTEIISTVLMIEDVESSDPGDRTQL